MASRHSQLCDAVVTAINGGSPYTVGAVTSVRKNLPLLNREDLAALIVWVSPGEETRSGFLSRGGVHTRTLEAVVHIAAPIDPTSNTDSDSYMELADEIKDEIVSNALDVLSSSMVLESIVQEEAAGDRDAADVQHTFETAITLSYTEAI